MAISVGRSSRTLAVVLFELCNAQLSRRKRVPAELDARSDLPEVVRRRKYQVPGSFFGEENFTTGKCSTEAISTASTRVDIYVNGENLHSIL